MSSLRPLFPLPATRGIAIPVWLRRAAIVWLVVYLPSYAVAYGWRNFLFLCNLGVLITVAAILLPSRLLLSSQAVAAPVIGLSWLIDFCWRLVTGAHLYGGTEYMWDPQYPLFTRLLSLYHVAWPLLVVGLVRRAGYDRRGWAVQSTIAAMVIVACRLWTPPAENINFAYVDPLFHRAFAPPALHVAIVLATLAGLAYGVTHAILVATDRRMQGSADVVGRPGPGDFSST